MAHGHGAFGRVHGGALAAGQPLVHGGATLAAGQLVQRGVVLAADGATNGGAVVLAAVLIGNRAAHWWLYQLPVS